MRLVIALGGNALLRRGQALSAANQRVNVRHAAKALAPLVLAHKAVITHGNGPQVGLLALEGAAYRKVETYPLDVLGAESEGMIGYVIEQELRSVLPQGWSIATLLTQTSVDPEDPAFRKPSKPIGPIYKEAEAQRLAAERGWTIAADGANWRRVVPSPRPKRIFEDGVIELLVARGVTVICAGGGGIPVLERPDGSLVGVEAVIDKDLASALLAHTLNADALLMLTDVDGVYENWGQPDARRLPRAEPTALRRLAFATGSMGPKIDAACSFVEMGGEFAAIGRLEDAEAILAGAAGTKIDRMAEGLEIDEPTSPTDLKNVG